MEKRRDSGTMTGKGMRRKTMTGGLRRRNRKPRRRRRRSLA
jgi:hypothetical protein